jgi:arsenate reductase-like glutaredoxin family protein
MVDWGIEELDRVVDTGDLDLLRTLWQSVVDAKADKARAVYRANKSAQRHEFESQLAQKLKSTAWVLDRHGDVRLPREVSLGELPEDWPPPTPSSLVHELDFGSDATQRSESEERVNDFLREEGLDVDGIDILREVKEAGIEGEELREWIRERRAVRGFPASASEDPARRAAVAELDAADAPEYTTASRLRTVPEAQAQDNAKSKIYLRGQYTTDTGEMFCQACRKPLPFKVNGQWYFEAVRFVSARKQVHAVNAIALCPLCAALYKHKRETKNEDLLEEIATTSVAEGQAMVEIPVLLNGKRVEIGFTGKHAIDIQATLDVAGEERGSDR